MQVILLQRVAKLGQMGEVVNVKPGYARNYLLPQGKALRANEANIKSFEARKSQLEADNLETKKEAEAAAAKIDGQTFIVIRSASESGALYGSVTGRDVSEAATAAGYTIARGQVAQDQPIKYLGIHPITVVLHPEVSVSVSVNVARSVEEAALQASGKSVQELAAEAEAQAEFEISELFDEMGSAASEDE
ncbi:50S ribosomal protein L9 [Pseudomonas sp. GX19020]|uniref:50S ribosomal protein L9 n=1 Tax=Pseudomonadota TaxID=1224 RepID=UPI00089CA5F0|nr:MULTISPECIES: 50S ribosomal protein L9 [Pseudomonadota]MCL4066758.1 50S ribosomal protein L9 [Pseudomonas sp. GX19020]SEB58946.1 LSU ribosomal protein L9P [Rhodobacter sp. 24-YEA-8]